MQNLSGKRTGFGQDSEELRRRSTEEAIPLENGGGNLARAGLGQRKPQGVSGRIFQVYDGARRGFWALRFFVTILTRQEAVSG